MLSFRIRALLFVAAFAALGGIAAAQGYAAPSSPQREGLVQWIARLLTPGHFAKQDCEFNAIELTHPEYDSTLYLDNEITFSIPLAARVDCADNLTQVEFRNRALTQDEIDNLGSTFPFTPQDLDPIGVDGAAPYEFVLPNVAPGATYAAIALGVPTGGSGTPAQSFDGVIYRVASRAAVNDADADNNAFPDSLGTLQRAGDQWFSSALTTATARRFAGIYKIYRRGDVGGREYSLRFRDATGTPVRVAATVNENLVTSPNAGYFAATLANSFDALYGTSEAARLATLPGTLPGNPGMLDLQIVTTSDGANFTEVPQVNLQARPLRVTLTGMTLINGETYSVWHHPTALNATPGDVGLLVETGAWTQVSGAAIDTATDTVEITATQPGAYAVFQIAGEEGEPEGEGEGVAEGEGEGEGNVDPPVDLPPGAYLWLILLILFILGLAAG